MEAVLKVGRNWLQKCLEDHESCRKKATLATIWSSDNMHIVRDLDYKDRMPRRLIQLDPETGNEQLKLVEVGQTAEHIPYIALSHSWGQGQAFKTTTANIEELKQAICLSALPKTFREAVEVTQGLGYKYLWIDSICIIQDNAKDWLEEAPRMAVVYGNADCNIMALDSSGPNGGLFNDPNAKPGTLLSRAWVIQERMIPSRSLLFSNNSLRWECRECDASQESPDLVSRISPHGIGRTPTHPKELFALMRDYRVEGLNDNLDKREFMDIYEGLHADPATYVPFLRAWWDFIEIYTPCKLSFETDKFLAMNGVAAVTQRFTRLRNTWGLWRDFMTQELVWSIDPAGPVSRRPTRWLAPYWSWASTKNGRVVNMYYKRLPIEPRLMLKPVVHLGVNTSFDQSLPIPAWNHSNYRIELNGDLRPAKLVTDIDDGDNLVYKIYIEKAGRFSEQEVHEFWPDAPLDIGSIEVQCLLMFHYDKEGLGGDHYVDIHLVLLCIGYEGDKDWDRVMKRIGYLETTYEEMRDYDSIHEDLWWKYVQLR